MNQNRKFAGVIALLLLVASALAIYFLLKGNLSLARLIPIGGLIVWGTLVAVRGGFTKKWHWILFSLLVVFFISQLLFSLDLGNTLFRKREAFNTQPPSQDQLVSWRAYDNRDYGFEFKFPEKFYTLSTDLRPNQQKSFSMVDGTSYCSPKSAICLFYTGDEFVNTNLDAALLQVVPEKDTSQKDCLATVYMEKNTTQVSVNGTDYAYDDIDLGNRREQAYRTYRNERCYWIALELYTGISSSEKKQLDELDKTKLFNYLSQVFSTFKFTK
ncbi:MAG: hypothetical protein HYX21_02980 [Candidatus Yanofskybacteria bacterium]|nr:hypothetical protein [Candidatus Yanofskybacteria bacterium]